MAKHRIAIQHIAIHWSKEDRGPEAGAVRNALPREVPFQPPADCETGWLQSIVFDAQHGYDRHERWEQLDQVMDWMIPVRTRIKNGHLWIKLNLHLGQPDRPNLADWIVRLPFGQRAAIHVNGKHDARRQRIYREHRLAIGFAETATLDLPLFREIDERVLLY